MIGSTEIEIRFTLRSRDGRDGNASTDARGLIDDMREAIIASDFNKTASQFDWLFDIVGEGFKITEIEG